MPVQLPGSYTVSGHALIYQILLGFYARNLFLQTFTQMAKYVSSFFVPSSFDLHTFSSRCKCDITYFNSWKWKKHTSDDYTQGLKYVCGKLNKCVGKLQLIVRIWKTHVFFFPIDSCNTALTTSRISTRVSSLLNRRKLANILVNTWLKYF